MKKKEYMSPDFKVVVLKSKNRLLVGSSPKHRTVALRNGEPPVIGEFDGGDDEELD